MSTRAYMTVIDENKDIILSAYYPSDGYPSYLGIQILDALEKGEYPSFIEKQFKDYPDYQEDVAGIQRSWYIKAKETKDQWFPDYAYEFDPSNQLLNLFHYGNKALTIPCAEIPFYRSVFKLEEDLYDALCFDENNCTRKKDFYKELRTLIKNGAREPELQALCEKSKSLIYMEMGRYVDRCWGAEDFKKKIRDNQTNGQLEIYAVKDYENKFFLYVQTPFYRVPIITRLLDSPAAVEKAIADLIHTRPEDIRATIRVFTAIESYKEDVAGIFSKDEIPLKKREGEGQKVYDQTIASLQEERSHASILGDRDQSFDRQIREVYVREWKKACERQKKTKGSSLDGQIQAAESRRSSAAGLDAPNHAQVLEESR